MLMLLLLLGAQIVVPLALIAAQAFVRPSGRAALWLRLAVLLLLCWVLWIAGFWALPPWYTPLVFAALAVLATLNAARRIRAGTGRTRRRAELAIVGLLGLLLAVQLPPMLAGRQAPEGAVDIAFPLAPGRYLVLNGGHHRALNAHFMTLDDPAYADWRGQSFAVDLIAIDRRGARAAPFLGGSDPAGYLIFGVPVLSPCDGVVLAAEGAMPDLPVPERDTERLKGNHLLIDCGGPVVLLAHLRQGSLLVGPGDPVAARQPLAEVGNSGQSGEPHLHVHVQRGWTPEAPLRAEPLPLTFDGRFPVRNERIVAP